MKKFIVTILALSLLTACNSPAQTTEGTQELNIDLAKIQMQIPSNLHIEIQRKPNSEPRIYVVLGEEYYTNGEINPLIRFTIEEKNFEEWMTENWDAPFYPLENSCEVEKPMIGEIFGCEQSADNITSYYQTNKMGELSAVKKYYFEREGNDWPKIEIWVDLYTDDFKEKLGPNPTYESMKAEFAKLQLTAEQKHRIKLAEDIIKSMKY